MAILSKITPDAVYWQMVQVLGIQSVKGAVICEAHSTFQMHILVVAERMGSCFVLFGMWSKDEQRTCCGDGNSYAIIFAPSSPILTFTYHLLWSGVSLPAGMFNSKIVSSILPAFSGSAVGSPCYTKWSQMCRFDRMRS